MRKFFILAILSCSMTVCAADKFVIEISGLTNNVTGVSTSVLVNGYVESVYIDIPTYPSYTGTVALTISQGGVILGAAVNADKLYHPRIPCDWTNGVAMANGSYTSIVNRFFLAQDALIASCAVKTTNNPTTNHSVYFTIRLDDK